MNLLQILSFKKGIRLGISYISNRYSKVNNKHFKSYDPKQYSKHIIYLDANNLYGYTMPKFLPTSGFKWINSEGFYLNKCHCLKSARIWSYCDRYFSALALNTKRYSVSLRIQIERGKIRGRITPNTDNFYAMYTSNSLKARVLKVDLKHPKKLQILQIGSPLAPYIIETKGKILSAYQIKIADLYNALNENVKNLVPNLFDKKKYATHYENLQLYFRL